MKIKRLIATVLASAMILTSQSFSCPVSAAEVASKEEVVVSDELSTEDASTDTEESSVTEENKDAEEISEEAAEEVETSESDEAQESELSEEESLDDKEDALDEEKVIEEQSEEGEEVLGEELSEENEEALEEELSEEDEEILDEEGFELLKSTDYFDVEGGVLKVKEDKVLESEVYIPANCETIPDDIFKDNKVVKIIHFDKSYDGNYVQLLTTIAEGAFQNSAIEEIDGLPSGVIEIPAKAFKKSNLKKITFQPDSTDTTRSSIGNEAINVTTIGDEAFYQTPLSSVVRYSNCTAIGESAFEGCTQLTQASFEVIGIIGESAFAGCSALTNFNNGTFSSAITTIGPEAFRGTALAEVDLRNATSLTGLSTDMFKDCVNLVRIYLPLLDAVDSIPSGFLSGCTKLQTVLFPYDKNQPDIYGIKTIDSQAFMGCVALKEVDLKKTYSIGAAAFSGCKSLTRITMNYNSEDCGIDPAPEMSIADDAFIRYTSATDRKNHSIKGYETEAQIYADEHGYTFETAYDLFVIEIDSSVKSKATIKLSKTKARENDEVVVTVIPAKDYSLTDINVGNLPSNDVKLKSCNATQQVFTFTMPDRNITISPTLKSNKNIATGKIDYYFLDQYNVNKPHNSVNEFYIDYTGEKFNMMMTEDSASLKPWLFTYSSSNKNVATISDKGELVALTEGYADIKATLIANTKKYVSCRVFVGTQKDIRKVEVKNDAGDYKVGIICKDKRVFIGSEEVNVGGETATYPLVEIMKSTTDLGNIQFDVEIEATDATDVSVMTSTDWVSSDVSVAKVSSSTSSLNKNTITVNKGCLGETLITISHLNQGEKKANEKNLETPDYEDNETKVIVRVINNTPRLAVTKYEVNAQKLHNYLPVYAVYKGKIYDDATLRLYYDAKCTVECEEFGLKYDEDLNAIDIVTKNDFDKTFALNAKKTYKNMYIKGSFAENLGDFIIPISSISLINKQLSPKYTSKNKINLFYNTTALEEEIGKVTVTNNLPKEMINGYGDSSNWAGYFEDPMVSGAYLISKSNYTRHKYDAKYYIRSETDPDYFNQNFSTEVSEDDVITIRRRAGKDPINKDSSKKNILSGYLYVEYAGYKYPVMTAYTVPTTNTAPSYVLSMTSATANTNVKGQQYEVYLYNKSDKTKTPISLDKLTDDSDKVHGPGLAFDYNKSTTTCFNQAKLRTKIDENLIYLNVSKESTGADIFPVAGKSVIRIHMDTWSDDGKDGSSKFLRYTFTLKTTGATPAASFMITEENTGTEAKGNKISFNKAISGESYTLTAVSNQPYDSCISELGDPVFTGKVEKQPDYDRINLDVDGNTINVTIDEDMATGTYNFTSVPKVAFYNGDTVLLKPLAFSVIVKNSQPKLSFGNGGTFKLNYSSVITENEGTNVITNYKLANISSMTALNNYTVDYSNASYTVLTKNPNPNYAEFTGIAEMKFNVDADTPVLVNRTCALPVAAKCKYRISGLKINFGSIEAELAPVDFTIQGYIKVPSMSLKATGGLDFVNRTSAIKYTAYTKDVVGTITNITLQEYGPSGSFLEDDDKHFELEPTPENPVILKIGNYKGTYDEEDKPEGSQPLKPNTKYKLRLTYTLDTTGDNEYGIDVVVTPTQKLPKLTVTQSRGYVYAGERTGFDKKKLDVTIKVPSKSEEKYYLDSIAIGTEPPLPEKEMEIQWAKNTPDTYKRAFDIGRLYYAYKVDETTGNITRTGEYGFEVELKNAAALQQNKTYTLNFVAYYEGQATNTTGTPIQVKVEIRK